MVSGRSRKNKDTENKKITSYGKITDNCLFVDGKYYTIRYIVKGALVLDTDIFAGKYGDEFPLDMVK